MADKPSDYFVGIHDFFGILVPGVVAVSLLKNPDLRLGWNIKSVPSLQGNQGLLAFVLESFLAGYLFNLTSLFLDRLTGSLQHRHYEKYSGRALYRRACELSAEDLSDKDRHLLPTYTWALATVQNYFPVWNADVKRLDAHTALFRSMTLVLVITGFLELYGEFGRAGAVRAGAAWVGAILSFLIFITFAMAANSNCV
jgi:hypothetical protein